MKQLKTIFRIFIFIGFFVAFSQYSCRPISDGKSSKARIQDSTVLLSSNIDGLGKSLAIRMIKGKAHNHPTFAVWIEDTSGKYIQTLFVTQAIGKGIFNYGDNSGGTWKSAEVRRPAALPYWAHKRGIINEYGSFEPSPKSKVPDAYSGATPSGGFELITRTDQALKGKVKLLLEINQPWDWNEFWNNTLYLEDKDYRASCQPAVVYSSVVDFDNPAASIEMKPIGHSHYSGKTGELFTDLSTITTALSIVEQLQVTIK